MFEFPIKATDPHSKARIAAFQTPHGEFTTPCFMPCGTKGAVKTLTPDELKSVGCEIMLSNTFHLMLRPGSETVSEMGGLHKWISWDRPMLTDSGGFQVFSLSKLRKINDEGVIFQSPIDGSSHLLTPERSIEIQEQLGADIIMAFDECPPGNASKFEAEKAMRRTHEWAIKCIKSKKRNDQALFPIVQGSTYPDLRKESAQFMASLETPGIAIGGVAVGEPKPKMWEVVETVMPILPPNKPRYLMGIGEPTDILQAISYGIDIFDCVLPTRLARHGSFWTFEGRKDIEKSINNSIDKPLDEKCRCYACANFSKSYLRHLKIEKEILGARLLTIHNLYFLLNLIKEAKGQILKGTFKSFTSGFISNFHAKTEESPDKFSV